MPNLSDTEVKALGRHYCNQADPLPNNGGCFKQARRIPHGVKVNKLDANMPWKGAMGK